MARLHMLSEVFLGGGLNLQCRWDNGPMCNLPISSSFDPQDRSLSLQARNPATGMLFWSDLQNPIFHILQTMATGTYHIPLERYSWGDCSAVGIVGNGSVVVEKFWEQVWQMWISGGELILEVCLGLSVVWIATYGYLRCCHRLWKGGWIIHLEINAENPRKPGQY